MFRNKYPLKRKHIFSNMKSEELYKENNKKRFYIILKKIMTLLLHKNYRLFFSSQQ